MPTGTRNGEEPVTEKKLWVPTSPLDSNTQRMAWLLFLGAWNAHVKETGVAELAKEADKAYAHCLVAAKTIRRLEQPEKHGVPSN